jgi:hypothetical protein
MKSVSEIIKNIDENLSYVHEELGGRMGLLVNPYVGEGGLSYDDLSAIINILNGLVRK